MNKNTYWNDNGKYQEERSELNKLIPDYGYTSNAYLNLYLITLNVYYDVYNNGGCNLEDTYAESIEKYMLPFASDLKALRLNVKMKTLIKNFMNEEKLESFMDEVILFVSTKDLNFTMYTLYFNDKKEELSKTYKDGYSTITFGNLEDFDHGARSRALYWNYTLVE